MARTARKAVVAGHICIDITPVFPKPEEGSGKKSLGQLLIPGKLLHVEQAQVNTGGAVANTGLAMKLLGVDVKLMGKVGEDAFGGMVLNLVKKYGASTEGMVVSRESSTSYTVVVAAPGIDRVFLHHPGANDTFTAQDIQEEALADAALFHFGYPPIMKSMYEHDGDELVKVFRKVKAQGIATSLDLAAVDPSSEAGRADWKKILTRVLPYVDFFVPSVEELCYMLDPERFREWNERAEGGDVTEILDLERDVKPLAGQCMELGAKVLLLKCGAPGMYYRTASREVLEGIGPRAELSLEDWADREGFEQSYVPEKILSGTGAGDTSIAAFLTGMLEGRPLKRCLQLSAATGACCVAAYDSLSGLKPLEELERKIDAGWEKQSFQK